MMETKGRRAPRAAGPIEAPAEPVKPIEVPVIAKQPAEAPTEPPKAPEILIGAAKPAETVPMRPRRHAMFSREVALARVVKSTSPDDLAQRLCGVANCAAGAGPAQSVEMAGLALGIDTAAHGHQDARKNLRCDEVTRLRLRSLTLW
jgi:hypothetical protein